MMAYTPGPWSADWDDNGQWYINIGGFTVSGNALRGDSGECVESANAYLIAAAPDLLLVARMAEAVAKMELREHMAPEFGPRELLEAAQSAISKAEGK